MKGVVLAAGRGKRLLPITKVVDKTVLPIYDRPTIFYAIETLVEAGIDEIVIVVNSFNERMIRELIGNGRDFHAKVNYIIKDHDLGMPFSILQAEKFSKGDSIMVIPGDNLFLESFRKDVELFKDGAVAFLREVEDLTRFGVARFEKKKLVDIVEKPKDPPSQLAVIAPYLFDNRVFDLIRCIRPSERGELEIVDLMRIYLGFEKLDLIKKNGYWADIGTFDSLLETSIKIRDMRIKK